MQTAKTLIRLDGCWGCCVDRSFCWFYCAAAQLLKERLSLSRPFKSDWMRQRNEWQWLSWHTYMHLSSFIHATTVNLLNIRTPQKIHCNHSKIWSMWLYHRVMSPNSTDRMANSVDPDQTAPLGAVWSGSALFTQTCLSENLWKLRYVVWSVLPGWHHKKTCFQRPAMR